MNAVGIRGLSTNQKNIKKYVKKDYTRVYDGRVLADGAKYPCYTLTDELIDFSQSDFVISGCIESSTGNTLAKMQ